MRVFPIIITAVLINLLLSYIMLLYNQPMNADGILYIHAAQAYLHDGFSAATKIYSWPFYSVLLAKVSTWLNVSFINTGFVLNSVFTSILIVFFILSVSCIENSPKALLWAAAVILLFPDLNHDRYNILRDIPYYGFFMMSFWSYLNFLKSQKSLYGIVWQLSILMAVLFRIEGAVFLILIPVLSFFIPVQNIKNRLIIFIKLFGLIILLGLFVLVYCGHMCDFGRIPELINTVNLFSWLDFIHHKIMGLKNYLGVVGQDNAGIFLISGLVGVFITSLVSALGILGCLIIIYGFYKKLLPNQKMINYGFLFYIIINMIILAVFMGHQLFMTWRYIFPLVLILLLYIPVIFANISSLWPGLIYLMINMAASFGQFGPSNSYVVEAAKWIEQNTPENIKLYSADETTGFYAHRQLTSNLNEADYVVIINKKYNPAKIILPTQPIKVFRNQRGDGVYIFKK